MEWPEYVRINHGRSGSAIATILARLTTLAVVVAGTIRDLLDASSAAGHDAPAILDLDGMATSYSELLRNVDALAAAVVAAGVKPDRAVAVVLPNGPRMATAFLGVSSAAVCAPLNPAYTEAELSFFYDDLDIAALVTDGCSAAAMALAERRGVPVLREPFFASGTLSPRRSRRRCRSCCTHRAPPPARSRCR